jgi:hypothetical protein
MNAVKASYSDANAVTCLCSHEFWYGINIVVQGWIFIFFKWRGGKISSGVQAALLSELRQGLGLTTFIQNTVGGVKRCFGGVEHFISGVREILGGVQPPPPLTPSPVNPPML